MKWYQGLILACLISTIPVSLNRSYGANSLSELQNELNTSVGYRGELENYITSHNISLGSLTFQDLDMSQLEGIVKSHMFSCQNGEHASMEKNYKEWYGSDNKTLSEMLASLGNC